VVKGLNDFPAADRPPVTITFLAFRAMVGIGTLMPLIALFAWFKRRDLGKYPWFLKLLPWTIPLPYLGMQAGWVVAEVGRQPWIVYGLMRTSDAVSPVSGGQVGFTLVAIVALYTLLGAAGFFLAGRTVVQGPDAAH
jgi:cytochrome d ubiquinol oxidase subunit I